MTTDNRSREELLTESRELRIRLEEAEETLAAIRSGAVDALVVSGPEGERIFTLHGAESPYRVLVESMNEGAATLAPDSTILYCNSRLAAMLQVPLERLIGARLASYMSPADQLIFIARLGKCTEECDKVEISLIAGNGDSLPILFSCCTMEQQEGFGIGVVITDIRPLKRTEALVREAQYRMRTEIVARLRAVEELREKEQMLIHQSRLAAMGEMINNIAHQWRQPLNALALLVQQTQLDYHLGELTGNSLDESVSKSMELIKHMSRTIEDFRNFFSPDKKKAEFRVNQEVAKTLSLLKGSLSSQNIRVEVNERSDPFIHGYSNEFCQVLLNILINARDVMAERGIEEPVIRISIDGDDKRVFLTIADNAGGIPAGIIDRIFDPYFTTKEQGKGTGVGLFMSKTIIEKNMGGRLSVRNAGNGAEFRIEI